MLCIDCGSREARPKRSTCFTCTGRGNRERAKLLKTIDPGMVPFGLPMERVCAEAFLASGSVEEAARSVQLTASQFRAHLYELARRAAARGYSPSHDMTKATPDGFSVKGVSSYYGSDGKLRGQWVKTRRDEESKMAALLDAMAGIAHNWKGKAKPAKHRTRTLSDLLAVYPMGDPHLGMFSWAQETGQNFDLHIAESSLVAAVEHLVGLAPAAEEALIINLGDFFHMDNHSNRTSRSGNTLDVDSRWSKVLGVGIRTMRRCIDAALRKHKRVTVICEIGNHDDHSSVMLAHCLAQFYEREPRVTVDVSPARFHWFRFGDNLLGVTHGDTARPDALPGIMATDKAKDWGETRFRYWYTGHVHHDTLKEYPGCIVETFRTLAPADAWHRGQGYRSGQDMKCDVLHKKYGRVNRHTVGIQQIWETDGHHGTEARE